MTPKDDSDRDKAEQPEKPGPDATSAEIAEYLQADWVWKIAKGAAELNATDEDEEADDDEETDDGG